MILFLIAGMAGARLATTKHERFDHLQVIETMGFANPFI